MSDSISIRYGKGELHVKLPNGCEPTVIRKPDMPVLQEPLMAIREALLNPVDAPSIAELAKGVKRVCIVICDITRPVPNGPILKGLIEQLSANGVTLDRITILIATGLHRPNLGREMREVIGDDWVFDNIRIENHFARDKHWMVDLGHTPTDGIPVVLNRHLVDADLRIAIGLVEPHFMAGYSGGRKVIAPGVAGEETIRTFHNHRFMADPLACNGNLLNNPLHRGQLEILKILGKAYAINTIIDEARRMSFVNFGDCEKSHLESVAFVKRYAEVPLERQFNTVVTSAAGYPLDKTYYQTVKGMVAPIQILADGGRMIIASACEEGLGSHEYRQSQSYLVSLGRQGFLDRIRPMPLADIDAWQTHMLLRTLAVGNVSLYSEGLKGPERELTGVQMVESIEDAIAASISQSGDKSIAIIPEGPYVIPTHAKSR
ncbi:MAG: nickel-dependent lactate racemase [Planctomycetota bacterium]|nr:nickel-dependent lactate racemase [Planctomycetota bacterium]